MSAVATRMVVHMSKQLSTAQDELFKAKDAQLQQDLKEKDLQIGKAQERAGIADKEAAEAKGRTALLEIKAAQLEQQAVDAKAVNLRHEVNINLERQHLIDLEEQVGLRRIQVSDVQKAIEGYPNTLFVLDYIPERECDFLAEQISLAMQYAGWKMAYWQKESPANMDFPSGVGISFEYDSRFEGTTSAETIAAGKALFKALGTQWKTMHGGAGMIDVTPNTGTLPRMNIVRLRVGFPLLTVPEPKPPLPE